MDSDRRIPRNRRGSVMLTPEKKLTLVLLKFMIWLDGFTQDGMKNIVNVYLVAIRGWGPLAAAWIWLIEMSTRIVYQPIIGTVVDRVKIHKYTILVLISLCKIGSGVCALTSASFGIMALKSVLDGIVTASFLSTVTAMTLGVVGKTRFHKKAAALNNIFKFTGASTGVLAFGLVSYYAENTRNSFWVLIGGGILMLICTIFMLSDGMEHDAVDHENARGRSTLINHVANLESIQTFGRTFQFDTDDEDSENIGEEAADDSKAAADVAAAEDPGATSERAGASTTDHAMNTSNSDSSNSIQTTTQALSYTQVMTYQQMYADPKRRKSLIFLSMVFFFYHIANSTAGPLLGQYISTKTDENKKNSITIMSGLMMINFVTKALTNWFLKNDMATKIGYTNVLLMGGASLFVRLILIGILVRVDASPWALGATQILEGFGGGCVGLMLMLYSHLLSRRTGHFNFNMGIVNSWKTMGSMVGIILGGAIAENQSYEIAFWVLSGVSFFPMIFALGISVPDLKRLD